MATKKELERLVFGGRESRNAYCVLYQVRTIPKELEQENS